MPGTIASPQKTKPFILGSPVGQQHLLLDHSNWRNSRRNGKFSLTSGMTAFGFSAFGRLIGDGRFGKPILWALPAIAFRDTPRASPICEMDKPCDHNSFSFQDVHQSKHLLYQSYTSSFPNNCASDAPPSYSSLAMRTQRPNWLFGYSAPINLPIRSIWQSSMCRP